MKCCKKNKKKTKKLMEKSLSSSPSSSSSSLSDLSHGRKSGLCHFYSFLEAVKTFVFKCLGVDLKTQEGNCTNSEKNDRNGYDHNPQGSCSSATDDQRSADPPPSNSATTQEPVADPPTDDPAPTTPNLAVPPRPDPNKGDDPQIN